VLGYYRAIASGRRLLTAATRVPALYLHGASDGCIGVELSRGIERAYAAGLERHTIDGAGHFLHLERPEVVNRLLVGFLSRQGRASAG
jgi:pimeloyl-ACP methyl ester carboxylesterase